MKIGMSERMFDKLTIEDSIRSAAKIGYDGVELRPLPNHLPADTSEARLREIKRMLADHGLSVPCIACMPSSYLGASDAECERQLDLMKVFIAFARELGCSALRHWAGNKPSREATADDWRQAEKWVAKAADIAAGAGIVLGLELHHATLFDTVDVGVAFVRRLGKNNVRLIHDAANLYQDGVDYGKSSIHALKGLLLELHVKDIVALVDDSNPGAGKEYRGRRFVDRPVNQGGVDQYSIFKGLKEIGYDGYVVVECGPLAGLDAHGVAENSYLAIRDILQNLGA